MKKSHIHFTKNLDNNYKKITLAISENIDLFNRDIFKFINNHFNISNNSNSSDMRSDDTGEYSSQPETYYNDEKDIYEYNLINELLEDLNIDSSGNLENDLSGNSENDLSGNLENDLSGNLENDLSGNLENDLSGNLNIDPSGNLENDEKTNCSGESTNKQNNQSNTIDLYKLPELNFNTNKKLLKKFYKKLIVKLHPDKRKKDSDPTLFQEYFEECKHAMEMKCIYKLWLLTYKMKIDIKITNNIQNAILKEINILKKYNETLESSFIYKWSNETLPLEKNKYILEYIKTNVTYN